MKKIVFALLLTLAVLLWCGYRMIFNPPQGPSGYAQLPATKAWEIALKQPIVPKPRDPQGVYSPYLPQEIMSAFPLPDGFTEPVPLLVPGTPRIWYGIMEVEEAGSVLDQNGIKYEELTLSGGQYAPYQLKPTVNFDQFDPLEYGYLIWYQGTYLDITIPTPTTLAVRKLNPPIPQPLPVSVQIPDFGKDVTVEWSVTGNPGLSHGWVPGKITEASAQYGYFFATARWRGGETVKLPEEMRSVHVVARDSTTNERIWRFRWYQAPS